MKLTKKQKINLAKNEAMKMAVDTKEQIVSLKSLKDFYIRNLDFIIIITLLSLLLYTNALNGQFVSDDIPVMQAALSAKSLSSLALQPDLQLFVYFLMNKIFGNTPTPLHIISMLLHLANGILFFSLLSQLFNKKVAALSVILFLTHPVNSETVSWISGINYLFNAFVFGISTHLFLLYRNTKKTVYLIASSIPFILIIVLTRNVWSFTIPPLLFVIDFLIIQRKLNLKNLIPYVFFIIPALLFLITLRNPIQARLQVVGGEIPQTATTAKPTPYLTRLPYSLYSSAILYLYPKNLTLYHEGDKVNINYLIFMGLITILFLISILFLLKFNKKLAGLFLFFLFSLAPILAPIQLTWFVAERYLYLGSVAFAVCVILLLLKIESKYKMKSFAIPLVMVLALIYTVRTMIRTQDWKTPKNLWVATEKVSPYSIKVHNNLGDIYGGEGDYNRAIQEFQTAIQIEPNYSYAMHNLGNTYLQIGQIELAKEQYLKALKIDPSLYQSAFQLGRIEYYYKNYPKAIEYMKLAIQINPNYEDAKSALKTIETIK